MKLERRLRRLKIRL